MERYAQSGDVHVSGTKAPVRISGSENVHIQSGSIDGDLVVEDAEYVYSGQEVSGDDHTSDATDDEGVQYYGERLEDVYVEEVDGTVVVQDAQDVFVEPSAVEGHIVPQGAEMLYSMDGELPNRVDSTGFGWRDVVDVERPEHGVVVLGSKCTVDVSDLHDEADLYVTGWNNNVEVTGRGVVTTTVIGSHNDVEIGGLLDADVNDAGRDNHINRQPFPVEELIQTRKEQAYTDASFGKETVTYQEPYTPEDGVCPVCKANADAVVETTTETDLFLFGHPVYQYSEDANYVECEECSDNQIPEVRLTESDREKIL